MLLTLNAACLRPLLIPGKTKRATVAPTLTLDMLPGYTRETLGLHGLCLTTDLLAGYDRRRLETFRERADKAGCSCLLLIESEPQALVDPDTVDTALGRMRRVVIAANILGCNSVAFRIKAADADQAVDIVAKRLRQVIDPSEKIDLTMLIAPAAGLTSTPERVTDIIKKVGGFRIGTFPDFQSASAAKDPAAYLRRLCPYAQVVNASSVNFAETKRPSKKEGGEKAPPGAEKSTERSTFEHGPYDLSVMLKAVASVGFEGTLAIDYRGDGDPIVGVTRTRDALLSVIAGPAAEDPMDLEDDGDLPEDEEIDADEPAGA